MGSNVSILLQKFVTDRGIPSATFIINLAINPLSLQDFIGLRFSNETCTSSVFTRLIWNMELL